MNQSILFPEMQTWDSESQRVTFPAQQSGALIECSITKEELEKLSGATIFSEQQALDVFIQNRFDIEELAEEQIDEEQYNELGQIEVTS